MSSSGTRATSEFRYLGDLPGAVTPVLLDVLTPTQAAEMFTRLAPRTADMPGEVAEVAERARRT
jgi:hypothetical protein